ncbi:MAG: argininosuccinate lyase [Ktedonobacteraceae bacterium]|nr:argininosuccinate lyase [Ktedonobacteraceae bacterium]
MDARSSSAGKPSLPAASSAVLGVGGRLAASPAETLVRTAFARELTDQLALFPGMSFADLAHTLMLMEAGVIPLSEGAALLAALLDLHAFPADFIPKPEQGDLYTNREAWLATHTSAVGWLGAGRARREATTIGYRISVRARLLTFADALLQAGRALVERAAEQHDTLMADYTYLQAAQPTTFGHYLLGFVYPLLRDLERLQALYARTNLSPAGCGSVNGSRIPQNRRRLAELLGFDGLVHHARDAMWQPDGPVEVLSTLVMALVNLDRLAEDLQIFATAEFGLVELADEHTRASVIMPQKKNPYALNYLRGATNELSGTLTAVTALARTPSGQVDNRIFAYGDVPRALELATGAVLLIADVIDGLQFNAAQARLRLVEGFATATDLAETIMLETGLDFRSAHRIAGRLVYEAIRQQRRMSDLTTADLDLAAIAVTGHPLRLLEQAWTRALDPASAVAARQQIGGAAPEPFNDMITQCRAALAAHAAWREQKGAHIAAAESGLLRRVQELAGGAPCPSTSSTH